MIKVFKTIKKKRNKRRLSALWLILVVIELLCPAMCGEETFAAEAQAPPTEIRISVKESVGATDTAAATSFDNQSERQSKTVCNDECLCHAAALVGLPFSIRKTPFFRSHPTVFYESEAVFNSLPPPFRPPKNS